MLGLGVLGLGVAAAAAALARRPLELLACSLPLVAKHGGEARVGGGAPPLAGADEVAVLVALALAHALVSGVVVVVVTEVVVVVVVDRGATHALGGGERAVVKVALAAEGGTLHLDEVAQVGGGGVLLAV